MKEPLHVGAFSTCVCQPDRHEWDDKPHRLVFDLCSAIESAALSPQSDRAVTVSEEITERLRLLLAKQQRCSLPCACYRNPQHNDCQTNAIEILALLNRPQTGEVERLREGIQNFIDGNWGTRLPKTEKCPHGLYGWDACEGCADEYFIELLKGSAQTGGERKI